jgi:hypothetical protein
VTETTTLQPSEGRCERRKQTRPLFAYEPEHNMHLGAGAFTCKWCNRDKQPMLCTRCWGNERIEEENDSALNAEGDMWAQICANNSRLDAQSKRDRETVAAIAAASGMDGV